MKKNDRTILHIDMNAFFASIEQVSRPGLKGKPVAVIGSGKRTIVTTASYEARSLGVKTGMSIGEAKKLCPDIITVVGNNDKYTDACMRIINILLKYTPLVEVFSIDEAFLDITYQASRGRTARDIGIAIKQDIKRELAITCSVGTGPNKLIAKLASGMQKPDGLVMIAPDQVKELMETLPVAELCGIGSSLEKHLLKMGIRTCGDLAAAPIKALTERFGIIGYRLHDMGAGKDETPVVPCGTQEETKSIGHSMTLDRDIIALVDVKKYILQLCEMVGTRMRREGFYGRTTALTVRYKDFTTFSKRKTIEEYFYHTHELYNQVLSILETICLRQPVRLLGVSVSHLRKDGMQMLLFDADKRKMDLTHAMDDINQLYGAYTVTWAGLLSRDSRGGVISPSWRPGGSRKHL